jgi:PAS domain S-box-containing protein
MLLSRRVVQNLLEAAEDSGLRRDDLVGPLGLNAADLVAGGKGLEWETFTEILAELSRQVHDDPERLRLIGRRILHAPSAVLYRRVLRNVVSARAIYRTVERWAGPASFPHLRFFLRNASEDRLEVHAEIPEAYAASRPFFFVAEGVLIGLPELIGLPHAVIVESRVTPRSLDLAFDLPRARTLFHRGGRMVRALVGVRKSAVLEEQLRDLSESVEALRRARDELRSLLDWLPDLVVVHISGTVAWANRAFLRVLGYERVDELVGTPLLDHVTDASKQVVRERMRQPADPSAYPLIEVVLKAHNGQSVVVEVAPAQPVVFDGVPARLVIGRDVTERVRMQQKLIVADRLSSVGLLAAGVAHEVNNPLAYVLNNIEIALKDLTAMGDGAKGTREVLAVALDGVARIRVIVRDLLMLSRGDDGTVAPVDVREVATSTLELAASEIERTAHLVQDFKPAPLVRGSGARIAQVLLNLVGNALEAMRGRPREQSVLAVRIARAMDGRVLLQVADTGWGSRRRIFHTCSSPSSRRRWPAKARGWGSPSSSGSSSRSGVRSPSRRSSGRARPSACCCRPRARLRCHHRHVRRRRSAPPDATSLHGDGVLAVEDGEVDLVQVDRSVRAVSNLDVEEVGEAERVEHRRPRRRSCDRRHPVVGQRGDLHAVLEDIDLARRQSAVDGLLNRQRVESARRARQGDRVDEEDRATTGIVGRRRQGRRAPRVERAGVRVDADRCVGHSAGVVRRRIVRGRGIERSAAVGDVGGRRVVPSAVSSSNDEEERGCSNRENAHGPSYYGSRGPRRKSAGLAFWYRERDEYEHALRHRLCVVRSGR